MGKKYRIGVLLHDFGAEYSQELLRGVMKSAEEHSCDIILFPIGELGISPWVYYYQHHALVPLISQKNLDGLVFATATQCNYLSKDTLFSFVKSFSPLPTVSVGYVVPEIPSITANCAPGLRSLIQHLISVHKCKRIALMGVNNDSIEAKEREAVYREVLVENNYPIDESIILYGSYTYVTALTQMNEYYNRYGKIDFDAIVSINDNMAYGCIDFCKNHDIKIPEFIITGYDNIERASFSRPTLTTVSAELSEQGYNAVNTVLDLLDGKKVESEITVPTKAFFRQSCGCVSTDYIRLRALDENGEVIEKASGDSMFGDFEWFLKRLQIVHFSGYQSEMQISMPLEVLRQRICKDIGSFNIPRAIVCLYSQPVEAIEEEPFEIPSSAYVFVAFDKDNNYCFTGIDDNGEPSDEIFFNPNDSLFPSQVKLSSFSGIVKPLFHCCVQYGYILFYPGDFDPALYELFLTTLSSTIALSFSYTTHQKENQRLEDTNKQLRHISLTDEMTQLLNRRGFMSHGQQAIDLAISTQAQGVVIFGDMDGLKKINDTYGHDAGDRAIKAEACILRQIFRSTDVIGRLGGDEFGIVAVGLPQRTVPRLRFRLEKICEKWNQESGEPYKLSISLGLAEFSSDSYDLEKLLKKADNSQYQEKRLKKGIIARDK